MEKILDILENRFPKFNSITKEAMVSDALYQMCCENLDYLIVLDDEERFQGIISDHDIASKVLFASKPLNKTSVCEFTNRTLPVVSSDKSIQYCLHLVEKYNSRHIAVYDDFEFKGVVSSHELMQHLQTNAAEEALDMVQDYPFQC